MPQLRRPAVDQRVRRVQLLQGDRHQRTVRLGLGQHHTSIGVARMNEHDAPAQDSTPPRLPDPPRPPSPVGPSAADRSGWSQPPAPQSPGPPGAFVDRPAAPPGAPLPPGAGSPVQPGPPMSVQQAIKDTAINMSAVLLGVGALILIIIVIVIVVLIGVFGHR